MEETQKQEEQSQEETGNETVPVPIEEVEVYSNATVNSMERLSGQLLTELVEKADLPADERVEAQELIKELVMAHREHSKIQTIIMLSGRIEEVQKEYANIACARVLVDRIAEVNKMAKEQANQQTPQKS